MGVDLNRLDARIKSTHRKCMGMKEDFHEPISAPMLYCSSFGRNMMSLVSVAETTCTSCGRYRLDLRVDRDIPSETTR